MESIETLNQRLIDEFGTDSNTNKPMFRIVFSDDQTEKIRITETESGVQLLFPEVKEIKKYSYIKGMYVLERLVIVPDMNRNEMLGTKLSYEPVWTYCDEKRVPVPPVWPATKFVIDTLYAALGKSSLRKYVDSEKNTTPEGREQRIQEMQLELFGNETETSDALRYREGIVVPSNYNKE
jgi:hypothetical protein